MKLGIYTIEGALFEGEAKKLIARTTEGEITVLDNHLPLVTTLAGPFIEIVDKEDKKNTMELAHGIMEVRPESQVVILAGEKIKTQ